MEKDGLRAFTSKRKRNTVEGTKIPSSKKISSNNHQKIEILKSGEKIRSSLKSIHHDDGTVISVYRFTPEESEMIPEVTEKHALESFIYPLSKEEFMNQIFRKKSFASVLAPVDKRAKTIIEQYLFDLDLESLLDNTASESIFVWMKCSKVEKQENEKEDLIESFELEGESSVNSAMICYRSGASLYFRSPEEMSRIFVRSFSQDLGMNFAAFYGNGNSKGEIEVLASRKDHITDWHFDFMENFTIQLKGR